MDIMSLIKHVLCVCDSELVMCVYLDPEVFHELHLKGHDVIRKTILWDF